MAIGLDQFLRPKGAATDFNQTGFTPLLPAPCRGGGRNRLAY